MSYVRVMAIGLLWGFGAVSYAGEMAQANIKSETPPEGKLGIIFSVPQDASAAFSWVLLLKGDTLIRKGQTNFSRPYLVQGLSQDKFRIVIVPKMGKVAGGLHAERDIEIQKEGLTSIRLNLRMSASVGATVTVLGFKGNPLVDHLLYVEDVTFGRHRLRYAARTDENGKYRFNGFSGHRYQLAYTQARPFIAQFRSQVIVLGDKRKEHTWQVAPKSVLKLRIMVKRAGTVHADKGLLRKIHLRRNDTGANGAYTVRNGRVTISKEKGLLAQANKITLSLTGDLRRVEEEYEIVRNKVIRLTKEKDQEVDVVIAKKREADLIIHCEKGFPGVMKGRRKPKVYIFRLPNGERVTARRAEGSIRLPYGEYLVKVWQTECRLAEKKVTISGREDVRLDVELKKAPVLKGRILDPFGKPISKAPLRPRYLKADYIKVTGTLSGEDGDFSIPIDDSISPVLWLYGEGYGFRAVPLEKKDFERSKDIRLESPCEVTGEITIDPDVEKPPNERIRWRLLWVNKDYPQIIVGHSEIANGQHKGIFQPGTYVPYVFLYRTGVRLDNREITITKGEKQKTVEPITVSKELWSKRKSLDEKGIR